MAELTAAGPVLVHFFDFAQLNSVRAMPYLLAWNDRYADRGLTTLGAHTPRFAFSSEEERLAPALEALGVRHAVADDSRYQLWHDYGCRGWPSLFLWGQGGALRWFHFGEGEYEATETAIHEELRGIGADGELPEPLAPLRGTDAPGALVAPPSEELFPGGSETEPWRAQGDDDTIQIDYAAGGAHASVSGTGELRVTIDDGTPKSIEVAGGGLYDLVTHPGHESHRLLLEARDGIEVYSVSFSAGLP
jgi:hypothetical protein